MNDVKFTYDKKALENIIAFCAKDHKVKVGVLSNEWEESTDGEFERKIGPAELAAVHEFGSLKMNIPRRSFFRKTRTNRLKEFIWKMHLESDITKRLIAEGNGHQVMVNIGETWQAYITDTFHAQGPGWAPLKKRTLARRRKVYNPATKKKEPSHKILWVSGALARSIHYEVIS